jgi:O-antigen/teichoic acid export membrane protein
MMSGGNKMLKRFTQLTAHPAFRRLSGEAFWVAFGLGLSTIGTFAGVRVLTSVLEPEEYGKLALAISVALGLVYSLGAGGGGSIARFFSVARQDGRAGWYWRAICRSLFSVAGVVVLLLAVLAVAARAFDLDGENIAFWGLTILFGGAWTVHMLGYSLHAGARRRKTVSWHQCVLEWGRFLAAFILIKLLYSSAGVVLAGFLIVTLLVAASEWFWVRKQILPDWSAEESSTDRSVEFFHYFWPLVISGLFFWIQMFADRWALKTFCSLEEVGIYFALYQISYSPMIYLSTFLCGFLGPVFYGQTGDGRDAARNRQTMVINERIAIFLLGAVAAGTAASFWIGPLVCRLLIHSEYNAGFWAFPWILAGGGIYAVAQQLLLSVYSGTDTRVMIPLRAGAAGLSFACCMTGARLAGFAGVVFGGLTFSIIFLAASAAVHLRHKNRASSTESRR